MQKLQSNSGTEKKLDKKTYESRLLKLLLNTHLKIERELLVMRLEQINKVITVAVYICDLCHEKPALIECLECKENYCYECSLTIHENFEDDHSLKSEIHPKRPLFK